MALTRVLGGSLSAYYSLLKDFKQILLLNHSWHLKQPLINDEKIVACKFLHNAGHTPANFCSIVELFHEFRHTEIFDPVEVAAGFFPQGAGEVSLTNPGKTVNDQILVTFYIFAVCIRIDFFAGEGSPPESAVYGYPHSDNGTLPNW